MAANRRNYGGNRRRRRSGAWKWPLLLLILAAGIWWIFKERKAKTSSPLFEVKVPESTNDVIAMPSQQPTTNKPLVPEPANQAVITNKLSTNVVSVITNKPLTNLLGALTNSLFRTNTNVVIKQAVPFGTDRPVQNIFEAQMAMAALGISSGAIDGVTGSQTRAALRAFQLKSRLVPTGELDGDTKDLLRISDPVYRYYEVTQEDIDRLQPVEPTWLGRSEQMALDYENLAELIAERFQSNIKLIRSLNPTLPWNSPRAGLTVKVPNIIKPSAKTKAAWIYIHLGSKTLQAFDASTNLLCHFPCSIAQKVEKRPVGMLRVVKVALQPNYSFDPANFPESPEAQEIGRKLIIPPGPNNPVGTAWIGLDKPGYGIHGTPRPEEVGRTESHGCFRLANWNAEYLAQLVWTGLPIIVEQ